jgi:GNAT superfamily N-acetyltransferase
MVKSPAKAAFRARPLTPDRWPDLEAVFGPAGGYWGCWCMYWRAPRSDFTDPVKRTKLKSRFKRRVADGPPPGLIAYAPGGEPVGWAQVAPRLDVPNWNGPRRLSAPPETTEAEDPKVWAVNCFVVRRDWRGKGVAKALLAAAVAFARKSGARFLDACPVDVNGEMRPPVSIYHGTAAMFKRAGFVEIARRRGDRPLMRLDLRA